MIKRIKIPQESQPKVYPEIQRNHYGTVIKFKTNSTEYRPFIEPGDLYEGKMVLGYHRLYHDDDGWWFELELRD